MHTPSLIHLEPFPSDSASAQPRRGTSPPAPSPPGPPRYIYTLAPSAIMLPVLGPKSSGKSGFSDHWEILNRRVLKTSWARPSSTDVRKLRPTRRTPSPGWMEPLPPANPFSYCASSLFTTQHRTLLGPCSMPAVTHPTQTHTEIAPYTRASFTGGPRGRRGWCAYVRARQDPRESEM